MKLVTEFFSKENKRKAIVYRDEYHWAVAMYINDKLWKTELITDHSLCYAEDLAENFVLKYGAFKDEV